MPFGAATKIISFVTISTILLPSIGLATPAEGQSSTSTTTQAAGSSDPGWPRQIVKNGTTLVYYQPQIDDWKDYHQIAGRTAFSLTPQGGKQVLGVVSFQAATVVDQDTRTVYFNDLKYTSVRFPSLDSQQAAQAEQT